MAFSIRLFIWLAGIPLMFTSVSFAQNVQRQEEEFIKDKQLEAKSQEYIKEREKEAQQILAQPITLEEMQNKNLVEVEANNILPSDVASSYALVPYKVRRPRWGQLFALTYAQFKPINYESDYGPGSGEKFEQLYGSEPMLELSYTYKWNFIFGSLGGELSYGTYNNGATDSAVMGNANLSLQLIRAGAKFTIDNLMYEPIVAPYVSAGVYTVLYEETQSGLSDSGTTGAAVYYGAGALFQLNWLDKLAAVEAYTESSIENTYLFAEVRQYVAASAENDPDFSTDLDVNFGMSLEF